MLSHQFLEILPSIIASVTRPLYHILSRSLVQLHAHKHGTPQHRLSHLLKLQTVSPPINTLRVLPPKRRPPPPHPIEHLQHPPLLRLPHPPQMLIRALQPPDLLLHPHRTPIPPPHQRTYQLPSQILQIPLQRHQLPIMIDQQTLIPRRLRPHARQQVFILLVFA